MNGINPKWGMYLGLIILLEQAVAYGSVSLTDMIPLAWIVPIVAWSKALATFGTIIQTYLFGVSSSTPGPLANTSLSPVAKIGALIAVVVASMLMFGPAKAADVAKASPVQFLAKGYPYQTEGMYFGIYTMGGGGNVQGSAPGISAASLTSNEAGVGGTVGYAWGVPGSNVFIAAEGMFGWRNFNATTPGFALDGPASFEQRFKVGTPISNLLSMLPNLGLPNAPQFPTLPAGQTVSNAQAYFMVGLHEDDNSVAFGLKANREWTIAPSIGVGVLGQLPNGAALDVWVETVFPDKQICVGPFGCAKNGQRVLAGAAILF